jgi:hypothetical protein
VIAGKEGECVEDRQDGSVADFPCGEPGVHLVASDKYGEA